MLQIKDSKMIPEKDLTLVFHHKLCWLFISLTPFFWLPFLQKDQNPASFEMSQTLHGEIHIFLASVNSRCWSIQTSKGAYGLMF